MIKYSLLPFSVGTVYFANRTSMPLFQIDITTQEGIVFFNSSTYPCFMVHKSLKQKLIDSGLTGFHFPIANDQYEMEFSIQNKQEYKEKKNFPNWSWIAIGEDEDSDVYLNELGEIICDERFINIIRERRLNEDRAVLKELTPKDLAKKEDIENKNDIPMFKKDNAFNPFVFFIIFVFALVVSVILFA